MRRGVAGHRTRRFPPRPTGHPQRRPLELWTCRPPRGRTGRMPSYPPPVSAGSIRAIADRSGCIALHSGHAGTGAIIGMPASARPRLASHSDGITCHPTGLASLVQTPPSSDRLHAITYRSGTPRLSPCRCRNRLSFSRRNVPDCLGMAVPDIRVNQSLRI